MQTVPMQPVPMPRILDPQRLPLPERDDMTIADHRARADTLRRELTRSCEYGQALWHTLEAVREYLVDSLPAEPDAAGQVARADAPPDGDDDEPSSWQLMYAGVTSSLAGMTGDSGYGEQDAQVIAAHRRA